MKNHQKKISGKDSNGAHKKVVGFQYCYDFLLDAVYSYLSVGNFINFMFV